MFFDWMFRAPIDALPFPLTTRANGQRCDGAPLPRCDALLRHRGHSCRNHDTLVVLPF